MKLGIIIGSVRENRVSDRLAKWVEIEAKKLEGIETKLIDLLDYPMPLFNEGVSPQFNPDRQPPDEVRSFLDILEGVDALVVVTPEYNRSYSSVLKNALDYIAFEIKRKPVMLAAHGSTGGAQAVAHLRGVFPGLATTTTPPAVMIVGPLTNLIDEDGNPTEEATKNPRGPQASLINALEELKWYSDALSKAR